MPGVLLVEENKVCQDCTIQYDSVADKWQLNNPVLAEKRNQHSVRRVSGHCRARP